MSDFHRVTQNGSKIRHATMTGVTCDTTQQQVVTGVACAEAWMQGVVWSCITCRVQYTMHQSTWKSFRDASEKCGVQYAGSYSDTNKEGNTCANDKGKQINKQTRSGMCRGTDAGGSMVIAQSAESATQCVRVCRRALEMFREARSSVHKVIL